MNWTAFYVFSKMCDLSVFWETTQTTFLVPGLSKAPAWVQVCWGKHAAGCSLSGQAALRSPTGHRNIVCMRGKGEVGTLLHLSFCRAGTPEQHGWVVVPPGLS